MIKWLDNVWYHYKWRIIFIAFFLSVAVVGIVQMTGKTNYDALFMYVGDDEISSTQYHEISQTLSRITSDFTKNGEVEINFSRTAYFPNPETAMDNQTNASSEDFLSTLLVQSYYIYFMRAEVFDRYEGAFTPLLDIFEEGELDPGTVYGERAVYLNKSAIADKNDAFSLFSDDVVICLKAKPYSRSKSVNKAESSSFQNHLTVFRSLVLSE